MQKINLNGSTQVRVEQLPKSSHIFALNFNITLLSDSWKGTIGVSLSHS